MTTQYPHETNGLINGNQYHAQRSGAESVYWDEPGLKITRLRLLTDMGIPFWDVSYCDGELPDGTLVKVSLPFGQIPRKNFFGFIIEHAKEDGVYVKGTGLFDAISKLW